MPLIAIIAGVILAVVGFRGTEHDFAAQLGKDFGAGSKFWSWAAAVTILGGLGYVRSLRTLSNLALALVIVALVLRNGGMFTQLSAVIRNPPAPSKPVSLASYKDSGGGSGGGGGGGGMTGMLGGGDSGGGLGQYAGLALALI